MGTIVAILHIGGALLAAMVLAFAILVVGAWLQNVATSRGSEEAALKLGVEKEDLTSPSNLPSLIQYSTSKYSHELFRNRISDFLGVLLTIWNWLGLILEVTVLGWAIWATIFDSTELAIFAWLAPSIALFFWLTAMLVTSCCKIILGRYPGEAMQARKGMRIAIADKKAGERVRRLEAKFAYLSKATEDVRVVIESTLQRNASRLLVDDIDSLAAIRTTCQSELPGLNDSPILTRYFSNLIAVIDYVSRAGDGTTNSEVLGNALEEIYRFQAVERSSDPIAVMERKLAMGHTI